LSVTLTVAVFFSYLILSIISSFVLSRGINRIGIRLNLAPGMFGLVTALAADTPEISSAIVALMGGQRDLGLSVVFGSNIFNLAAVIGLSAIVSGGLHISRSRLILNGAAGILILGAVAMLLLISLNPWITIALTAAVFIPYTFLAGLHPTFIQNFVPSGWLRDTLSEVLNPGQADEHDDRDKQAAKSDLGMSMLSSVLAVAAIVFSSRGIVISAVSLARHWKIEHHIVGVLVLATLTGIPNVTTAVRLALKRRGAVVVSEGLNSNTLNLLAGVCLPAVVLGLGAPSRLTVFTVWWLVGMTVVALALTSFQEKLGRWGGVCLLALYLVFIGFVLF
jgi:cation:H+ antiporter